MFCFEFSKLSNANKALDILEINSDSPLKHVLFITQNSILVFTNFSLLSFEKIKYNNGIIVDNNINRKICYH